MKTKLLLVSILMAFAGPAVPAAPLTVAVYDFTEAHKHSSGTGADVTTLVTADLAAETNLVMVERAELTKALNEQAFGVSGMVSSDAAAKIGQITPVRMMPTTFTPKA